MSLTPEENVLPSRDGQMVLFGDGPSLRGRERPGHRVLYVNGIRTQPADHRATCLRIAREVRTPVWGVYNQTGTTFTRQMGQISTRMHSSCESLRRSAAAEHQAAQRAAMSGNIGAAWSAANEYAASSVAAGACEAAESLAGVVDGLGGLADLVECAGDWTRAAVSAFGGSQGILPESVRHVQAGLWLGGNAATLALYNYLYAVSKARTATQHIILHSQGNLIGSCAVSMLWWVTEKRLDHIHVYSLASPAPAWPTQSGMKLHGPYAFHEDMVTWLSLGRSYWDSGSHAELSESIGPGVGEQHSVDTYLQGSRFPVIQDLRRALGVR